MAADRTGFYLGTVTILTTLITGCSGQCVGDPTRPQVLNADDVWRVLRSPHYDSGSYPSNSDCGWRIQSRRDQVVQLSVVDVDLEGDSNCYGNITIYDGYSVYANIMARFCTEKYQMFYSSGRYMYVNFTSDSTIQRRGFRLKYISVPAGQRDRYTTRRPSNWRTTSTYKTTTTFNDDTQLRVTTVVFAGGGTAAMLSIFILVVLCRYCCNHNAKRRARRGALAPYILPPTRPGTASGSGPAHHSDSAVFTLSGMSYAGHANMGFSSYGDAPPPYESLQPMGDAGRIAGAPPYVQPTSPPAYSEVIRMSGAFASPKPEQASSVV